MKYTAIIVAAGSGSRFGSSVNKVWHELNHRPVLYYSIDCFLNAPDCESIIVVHSSTDLPFINSLLTQYPSIKCVIGGSCREESVWNGLQLVRSPYVLIHDGARPFITIELINRIVDALSTHHSIIPVIDANQSDHPDREVVIQNRKVRVQTPQAFYTELIKAAFHACSDQKTFSNFRDDASIVEYYENREPFMVEGELSNKKITYSSDL